MPSLNRAALSKRYHALLHRHMSRPTHARSSFAGARALGIRSIALHVDVATLCRIHHQALAAFDPFTCCVKAARRDCLRRAAHFFLEVIAPQVERLAAGSPNRRLCQQLATQLKSRTSEVAVFRRRLTRETARHKAGEARLLIAARHYRRLLAQSRRMQERSRTLARQVILAQEAERKEISRDLHDDVAQILAGINVQLASLSESAAINDRKLLHRITQAQRMVGQSVEAVHRFARELRPALLDDLGLIPALRSFISGMTGRNGLRVELDAFSTVEDIGTSQRTVLYRVAQEALTNVMRHAHARVATVRITHHAGRVCLAVHDDGRSFQAERVLASPSNRRLGLVGMRERVEMVGGTFTIHSEPSLGTTVRAAIPLRTNAGKHP